MLHAHTKALIALALAGAPAAHAADLCQDAAYDPAAVLNYVEATLADHGIASLDAAYDLSVHDRFAVPGQSGLQPGRVNLLQDGAVLGQVSYTEVDRAAIKHLTVFDVHNTPLLEMTYREYVCPDDHPLGLCREITASTDLQRPAVTDDGVFPAFRIIYGPDSFFPAYFRYGAPVGYRDWSIAFNEALAWLDTTLTTTQDFVPIQAATPHESLWFAFASDPAIAPYLPLLTIIDAAPRLIIAGAVPNDEVWDHVWARARDVGVYIDMQMSIDGRIQRPVGPYHVLLDCYRG